MQRWRDVTVGDLVDGLKRYQPFLLTLLAVVLIVTVLPGRDDDGSEISASDPSVSEDTGSNVRGGKARRGGGGRGGTVGTGGGGAGTSGSGATPDAFGGTDGSGGGGGGTGGGGPGGRVLNNSKCDRNTGRIRIPSVYAPPCAPRVTDNGGNTSRGVTAKEIVVAIYIGQLDPATGTILRQAGAEDDPDDVWETYKDYADYFNTHYEMYGRKMRLVRINGGLPDDDVAANSNAQKIIDAGAFVAVDGPTDTNIYMRKLARAGIICVCTTSQPIETYLNNAPYVWNTLMASTQYYTHRAEYVGKRLWGRKAEHAGDTTFRTRTRTFGLVYFDTAEGIYKAGADFFERELRKYGARLTDRIAVTGAHVDTAGAQQEAGVVAERLRDKGITSVIFAGDPLYPIFLTKEATNRLYRPEWILTGAVLSDTTTFGRLYAQEQWANSFGVSALPARLPEELSEAYRLHGWHHGRTPTADGTYAIRFAPFWIAVTGIHMAGPNLTVQTFRDGLFAYPPSGGGPTNPLSSFGRRTWRWDDYLRFDDMAEIWWDVAARGESEIGTPGTGMYRYVSMGKRYKAGSWPRSEPNVFTEANTVTIYDQPPKSDRWPDYPPHHAQQ